MSVEIRTGLSIPDSELSFTASRSGGPGGQHVNKVNSRITLAFDVRNSPSLEDAIKQRLLERLASRLTRDGVLQIHSQEHRSQEMNRQAAIRRFADVMRSALTDRRKRIRTRPHAAAAEKRIETKKRRASVKEARTRKPLEDA